MCADFEVNFLFSSLKRKINCKSNPPHTTSLIDTVKEITDLKFRIFQLLDAVASSPAGCTPASAYAPGLGRQNNRCVRVVTG